jgi:hypothetical protein
MVSLLNLLAAATMKQLVHPCFSRSDNMTARQVLMRNTGKRSMVTLYIGDGQCIALALEMM